MSRIRKSRSVVPRESLKPQPKPQPIPYANKDEIKLQQHADMFAFKVSRTSGVQWFGDAENPFWFSHSHKSN